MRLAARTDQHILGQGQLAGLQALLELGLGILRRSAGVDLDEQRLVEVFDHAPGVGEAPIQINSTDHRLQSVGQNGGATKAAAFQLAFAQPKQIAKLQRLGKIGDKLSAEFDYRVETVDATKEEVVQRTETVGELIDHITSRSVYYIDEEWKTDEGNITAQTIRYCRHYCPYELWTQNTKFKDTSFNPQRTNTYTRGAEFVLAGGIMGVYAAVNEEVERGHVANIVLIFLICYAFVAISYRSNSSGLILVFSLAVATIGSLAYMALRETGLTIQTLPVQSVGVGIGVDYSLYVTDRIKQEYTWCGDLDEAIRRAIRTTGMAVSFTATTLIAGIVVWSFSNLRFQAEMAQLLSILMGMNMLGAVFLVPACVSIVRPKFFSASPTVSSEQHDMGGSQPKAAAGGVG